MLQNIKGIVLVFFISSLLASCTKNRLEVDIEAVSIPQIKFQQLQNDVFEINSQNITQKNSAFLRTRSFTSILSM